MIRYGRMLLIAALAFFLVFFGSVAMGAAGFGQVFSDVTEMLTLLVAVLLFVAGVLILEAVKERGVDTP